MELVVEVVGVGIIDGSGAAIDGGGGGSRSGVGEHDVAGVHFLLLCFPPLSSTSTVNLSIVKLSTRITSLGLSLMLLSLLLLLLHINFEYLDFFPQLFSSLFCTANNKKKRKEKFK